MQETQVWSLGQEPPIEEEMATHSRILAWESPRTEEPSRLLQSMRSQRVRRMHRSSKSSTLKTLRQPSEKPECCLWFLPLSFLPLDAVSSHSSFLICLPVLPISSFPCTYLPFIISNLDYHRALPTGPFASGLALFYTFAVRGIFSKANLIMKHSGLKHVNGFT